MLHQVALFTAALFIFLYAIAKLNSEVQKLFTDRIRQYIKYSARTRLSGLVTGIVSTMLFQSSSTTTSLIVGMVSAGLLSLYEGLAMVLGTDIGTTFTVQLVVWKVTALFPLFIVGGALCWFAAEGKWKVAGEVILHFGLLIFALYTIGEVTAPLRTNAHISSLLEQTAHPLIGFVAGAIFTAVVHASVIPISIVAILAQSGVLGLQNALPIVFGANVGTTVTALMAGLVSNVNGRRAAIAHLLFKCTGAAVCFVLLPVLIVAIETLSGNASQQIALGHFLFNLIIAALFLFLLKPVSATLEKLVPGRTEKLPIWPAYLNEACLARTEEALLCVKRELERQIRFALRMVRDCTELLRNFRKAVIRDMTYVEAVVDNLRSEIAAYLWKISDREFSPELSRQLFTYTAMVDDIERIGDHAMILAKLAAEKEERHIGFSDTGMEELDEIHTLVLENVEDAAFLIGRWSHDKIKNIASREESIDMKVAEARAKHLERFHRRVCRAEAGPVFLEMLINLERISDHCQNIAEYVDELRH